MTNNCTFNVTLSVQSARSRVWWKKWWNDATRRTWQTDTLQIIQRTPSITPVTCCLHPSSSCRLRGILSSFRHDVAPVSVAESESLASSWSSPLSLWIPHDMIRYNMENQRPIKAVALGPSAHDTRGRNLTQISGSSVMQMWCRFHLLPYSGVDWNTALFQTRNWHAPMHVTEMMTYDCWLMFTFSFSC